MIVLLTDEVVSVDAVCLDPVELQRPVKQKTVHSCLRFCTVHCGSSRGSPARVADRFEVMFRCPHPALVAHHKVAACPPTVDVLVLYARTTHRSDTAHYVKLGRCRTCTTLHTTRSPFRANVWHTSYCDRWSCSDDDRLSLLVCQSVVSVCNMCKCSYVLAS